MALIAQWALQDTAASTTIVDSIGGYDGTIIGGETASTMTVAGPGGSYPLALEFDGNDRVSTTYSGTNSDFTACAWAYVTGGGVAVRIIDKSYSAGFYIGRGYPTASGYYHGGIQETSDPYGTDVAASDNAWHHVAMSRSGTTKKIYVDGALASTTTVGSTNFNTTPIAIGGWSGGDYIQARIADVRFYDTALDLADIEAIVAEVTGGGGVSIPLLLAGLGELDHGYL